MDVAIEHTLSIQIKNVSEVLMQHIRVERPESTSTTFFQKTNTMIAHSSFVHT